MARMKIEIQMEDCESKLYNVRPKVQAEFETKQKKAIGNIEEESDMFRLAHYTMVDAGDSDETFTAWLDRVAEVIPTSPDADPLEEASGTRRSGKSFPSPSSPVQE